MILLRRIKPLTLLVPRRLLSSTSSPNTFTPSSHLLVTTPIFYVNAQPHVGHLHSALLADAASRWHQMSNIKVLFTTGTDEHGLKVQEAAEANNQDPQEFCDQVSSTFRHAFDAANIQCDRFVRTTDPDHEVAVRTMWKRLVDSGDLYLGTHEGWYCASDEVFLPDNQVQLNELDDGDNNDDGTTTTTAISIESGKKLRWISEENWKFRLSAYEERLLEWLEPLEVTGLSPPVKPRERTNEVKQLIQSGLKDISVSRLRDKVPWALPVPNDEKHSIYVWVDALTNYLTVTGFGTTWGKENAEELSSPNNMSPNMRPNDMSPYWPAHCHIIGKDILRFHAVYWPAFLMAAKLPLPKSIVAHGHWTTQRVKMSKSLGNVVSPTDILAKWGVDPVRYFFLRDGSLSGDADFSEANVSVRFVSELADTLGNLVGRCTGKSLLPERKIELLGPGMTHHPYNKFLSDEDWKMIAAVRELATEVEVHYNNYEFGQGIEKIMDLLRDANGYFSSNEPWTLRKRLREGGSEVREDDQMRLDIVVYITLECVRISGILLQPIIPNSSDQLLNHLDVPKNDRTLESAKIYGRQRQNNNKNSENENENENKKENNATAAASTSFFEVGAKNFVLFDKKKMIQRQKKN